MDEGPPRVLVADFLELDELEPLRAAGLIVEDRRGIGAEELLRVIADFAAILVRSRTRVDAAVLECGARLRVVGRAGTGVDNVDLDAATRGGVVVMNCPGGNATAAAEHTIALLAALARRIPQAAASLARGEWERKAFLGVELAGRTLGVVGLGKIGQEVARRGRGLGMEVVAFDPVISEEAAQAAGAELRSLADVVARCDVLTVHVPLGAKTRHLVNRELLGRLRPGAFVLNVARGGIVDEVALLDALEAGHLAGAALDVFEEEPPTCRALIDHPHVVATPHLGASTVEAQRGVARQIADQVARYLTTGEVVNAVNLLGLDARTREELAPWFVLCRRLGELAAGLVGSGVERVGMTLLGDFRAATADPLLSQALLGFLRPFFGDRVNAVNAALLARERGLEIQVGRREHHRSFTAVVRISAESGDERISLDGTLFGRSNLRLVRAFGFNMDAIPESHMIFCAHDDQPGLIAHLGATLAAGDLNIANMSVARDPDRGHALAVLNLDQAPGAAILDALGDHPQVRWIRYVALAGA